MTIIWTDDPLKCNQRTNTLCLFTSNILNMYHHFNLSLWKFVMKLLSLYILFIQGVVTAAISLITCLSQKNPDEFKTCVSLAVSRLSRVFMSEIKFLYFYPTLIYLAPVVPSVSSKSNITVCFPREVLDHRSLLFCFL